MIELFGIGVAKEVVALTYCLGREKYCQSLCLGLNSALFLELFKAVNAGWDSVETKGMTSSNDRTPVNAELRITVGFGKMLIRSLTEVALVAEEVRT